MATLANGSMGMCGPEDPLFTPLLPLARVPFQAKELVHKTPFWEFGNFSLNSLDFHPNFSSQAPKFGHFQLTSPQIWKFSAHKPSNLEIFRSQAPLFRGKCQFASPTLRGVDPFWTLGEWSGGASAPIARLRAQGMSEGGCAALRSWRNLVNTFGQHFDKFQTDQLLQIFTFISKQYVITHLEMLA